MPFSCFLFRPRKSREKRSHTNVSSTLSTRSSTPPAQTPHVRFHERKWVHARLCSKDRTQRLTRRNRGFTFVQSCRAFDRPSSGKRTAGGSGCTPMACVRFLRHRSPAGLRNILFGLPMLYFSRSAHGDFCVCEVKAVPRPCGQYAGHLSAWRPGTCPAGPPAGCTAA